LHIFLHLINEEIDVLYHDNVEDIEQNETMMEDFEKMIEELLQTNHHRKMYE
jgi:hypothetical protein